MKSEKVIYPNNFKKTRPHVAVIFALAITVLLLVSCGPGGPGGSVQAGCNITERDDKADLGEKIRCYVAEVAWFAATLPVVGPIIDEQILRKVPPEEHWIVGAGIILVLLLLLGGGSSVSRNRS